MEYRHQSLNNKEADKYLKKSEYYLRKANEMGDNWKTVRDKIENQCKPFIEHTTKLLLWQDSSYKDWHKTLKNILIDNVQWDMHFNKKILKKEELIQRLVLRASLKNGKQNLSNLTKQQFNDWYFSYLEEEIAYHSMGIDAYPKARLYTEDVIISVFWNFVNLICDKILQNSLKLQELNDLIDKYLVNADIL